MKLNSKYDVAIFTTAYNTKELLKSFLNSVQKQITSQSVITIVTDNGSEDNSGEMVVEEFPDIHILTLKKNIGQVKALNLMSNMIKAKYFLFCHADIILDRNVVEYLVNFLKKNSQVAVVSPLNTYPDGSVFWARNKFPTVFSELKSALSDALKLMTGKSLIKDKRLAKIKTGEVDFVRSAAVMIPSKIFQEVGGFDSNLFSWKHVHDLCWKVKNAGYKVWYHCDVNIIHFEIKTPKEISKGAEYKQDFSLVKALAKKDQLTFYRNHFSQYQIIILKFCEIVKNLSYSMRKILVRLFT